MSRILFRTADATYRAFELDFKDAQDGSLYIFTTTVQQADGSGGKTLQVSYHATGRVNFKIGEFNRTVYSEPIFAISKPQRLCCVSLANIERLPKVGASRPDDLVTDCSTIDGDRLSLYVVIAPPDASPLDAGALVVKYENWFTIQTLNGPPPENDIAPGTNRVVVVDDGFFTEQQISQEPALIFFHRKCTGIEDSILYWDAANKLFRIIFSVPMRIAPKLNVTFAKPDLEAVPQDSVTRNTETAELRFKVRGPGGFLPEAATITGFKLDAEL